jgi:hypothetical protein
MRKISFAKILIGFGLIGSLVACNLPVTQIAEPETETPAPTASPTQTRTATSTSTPRPTNTETLAAIIPPPTSTPKFAPFCQPSSASIATPIQCQLPIAEQSSSFCQDKSPYNLVLINPGSSFEISNEDIQCEDVAVKDGKLLLTCTGPMAAPFEMKVCDPFCTIQPFQASVANCPEGLNFNEQLNCCEREPVPIGENCVVLKLQTRSCVIDCSGFNDQKTCDKNAYACNWDNEFQVCYQRK